MSKKLMPSSNARCTMSAIACFIYLAPELIASIPMADTHPALPRFSMKSPKVVAAVALPLFGYILSTIPLLYLDV
ncbi:MAG: hypothetical protein U0X92_10660 [Anaerolineales bacterium]